MQLASQNIDILKTIPTFLEISMLFNSMSCVWLQLDIDLQRTSTEIHVNVYLVGGNRL